MDLETLTKIESLRNDFSDAALNYLKSISHSISAPEINTGCWCKESSRIEWSRRWFMYFDTVKRLD